MDLTPEQQAASETTPPDRLETLAAESIELARIVARNPLADPHLLEKLAASSDRAIREGVASNPNTPTEVLLELGAEFPKELLENPVFSLWVLENPNFSAEIPLKTLRSLAAQPHVPVSLRVECGIRQRDRELLLEIASDRNLSPQVLNRLAQSGDPLVVEASQLHVSSAGEMAEGWEKAARDAIAKSVIASSEAFPSQLQQQLQALAAGGLIPLDFFPHWQGNISALEVFVAAADSPRSHPGILEKLAESRLARVERNLANNSRTPARVLERLARKGDEKLCLEIAKSPHTPASVFSELVQTGSHPVRLAIAGNPAAPAAVLEQLAGEITSESERSRAAETTENAVREIVRGAKEQVNEPGADLAADAVARALLQGMLQKGSFNSWDSRYSAKFPAVRRLQDVQQAAQLKRQIAANPSTPPQILEQWASDASLQGAIAANPNTPASTLKRLMQNGHWELLLKLSDNPNLPASLLAQLARNSSETVRARVAKHPNMPVPVLEELAAERSRNVRVAVADNPNTPVRLLEELARAEELNADIAGNPRAPVEVLARLLREEAGDRNLCQKIARNPATPGYLLEYLYQKQEPDILRAIATNPHTPENILQSLAGAQSGSAEPIYLPDLIQNPNLPASVWKSILHCDWTISRSDYARKYNRQFPYILPHCLNQHPEGLSLVLEHYARSTYLLPRLVALLHPQVKPELLANAAHSIYWQERYAAALHPNTPVERLEILSQDANRIVRAAAKSKIRE